MVGSASAGLYPARRVARVSVIGNCLMRRVVAGWAQAEGDAECMLVRNGWL